MGFPWATMSAVAAVSAYGLTYHTPQSWPQLYLFVNFVLIWAAELLLFAVWTVFLYPKLFSPLLGLPEPKNESWWNGQYARIARDPSGKPMMDW